jgi:hypothetical protein
MRNKLVAALVLVGCFVVMTKFATSFHRSGVESWAQEFPVEGLVVSVDGAFVFEPVPLEDIKTLSHIGFPQAMRQFKTRVRHLVIYQDCHYFFTTDGRVLVMTLWGDGPTPRLVETKRWNGAPHEFREYRKDLLPST